MNQSEPLDAAWGETGKPSAPLEKNFLGVFHTQICVGLDMVTGLCTLHGLCLGEMSGLQGSPP